MAFKGFQSWTPLEIGDGDLGTTYRPVDLSRENTEYFGHGENVSQGEPATPLTPYADGFEMSNLEESVIVF